MPSLYALGAEFTVALRASTVRPSGTVPALASLATGVAPATHHLTEPGLSFLSTLGFLRPVARELAHHGIPTEVVTADLGPSGLAVAWGLASRAGARLLVASGQPPRETAGAVDQLLSQRRDRLYFVYLPGCDRAGHAHGWMSQPYLDAATEVDAAIGALAAWTADTVFVITADHGGGGITPTRHDEVHPDNERIPLIVAGPGVKRRHHLARSVSLLDVPATALWWFGVPVPQSYEGQPLSEAFAQATRATAVAI
jgi:predicted AlkP superfamily pyrophosphatase or phosphodiesterase